MRFHHAVLLLAFTLTCRAVETGVVTVTKVWDGDTIEVKQGVIEFKVRLEFVDTPEGKDNSHGKAMPEGKAAHDFRARILPPGSAVRLFNSGQTMERDGYGRALAIVYLGPSGYRTAQEEIIRNGWSPYWRKYGSAPGVFHERFSTAMADAKKYRAGVWRTNPQWMTDKGNERTASKKKK